MGRKFCALFLCIVLASLCRSALGQECVTQSRMQPAEREEIVQSASALATSVQAGDAEAIKSKTVPQYAKDFSGIAHAITNASPHLKNAKFQPSTLWILDANALKPAPDGTLQDAEFFCTLNNSAARTSFQIPSLPAGRYALAILNTTNAESPWQLAFLLKQTSAGPWQLAGFFPRATTAAGHDGLWYWEQARMAAAKKQNWNAWLEYGEAELLLKPVDFMESTHLDQLHQERDRAKPSALSGGISSDAPLLLKAADGTEYQVTSLSTDDSLHGYRVDVAMHYRTEAISDPTTARTRNRRAAGALVAAYPELKEAFHGVWVFADAPGIAPFASEEPMSSLQ